MQKLMKSEQIGKQEISVNKKHINAYCNTHFHEFYEIEYVCNGSGKCILNGQSYPMESGMLFFMTPLDYHSVYSDGTEIFNVMFSQHFVDFSYLEPFLNHSAPKAFAAALQERPFFELLLSEMSKNQSNVRYQVSLLECLLMKLSQKVHVTEEKVPNKAVSKMHFYALNNFRGKATLEEAADFAGMTPTYASALFKREMQVSFKGYIDSLRFDHAKKMLRSSKLSVAEICIQSGFEDVPNFYRRFRSRYGMTPIQFRKSMNGP